MKAKFTKQADNARNLGQEKELVSLYRVIGYKKGAFECLVDCRCYMGRANSASVVYSSIWVGTSKKSPQSVKGSEHLGFHTSGRGQAGGYGYHKQSQAIENAITSAGIKLDKQIGGVGDSAIREALLSIGKAFGYNKLHLTSVG